MDKEVIGKRIHRQREKLSLTRDEFAEQIEISPRFLAEIENGTKGMSSETLYKICEKADISADYVLLRRQSTNGIQTPAVELLSQIPSQYSEMIEDVFKAFIQTIKIAGHKEE